MRNWGTGRRGPSRSYGQLVSNCDPGRLTLHLSIFSVISQYPFTLDLLLFYSIPFHSAPFHSVPFRSVLFRSVPFHSIPFCSIPAGPWSWPDYCFGINSAIWTYWLSGISLPKSWHSLSGFDLELLLCLTTFWRTPSPVGFYFYCCCCYCSHNDHNVFCYYFLSDIVLDTL